MASRSDRPLGQLGPLHKIFSWLLPQEERSYPFAPAPDGNVIYAVGDIHGRADLLEALGADIDEDAEAEKPNETLEIYLGDYIDRGSNSAAVIDWLIKRQESRNAFFLRGNHESLLEDFFAHESAFKKWRELGALETLLSYGIDPALLSDPIDEAEVREALALRFPSSHRRFLDSLVTSVDLGAYFFVHAGVRPGVPLDQQDERDCLWIRDEFLDHEQAFARVIVHGHSPVAKPEFFANRINLDTAAFATGRLSCLKISEHGANLLNRGGR